MPIKRKCSAEIIRGMNIVFKSKQIPKNLHTDMGTEFYNKNFKKLMEKYKINHYSTYSVMKAAIVERFIRTIKNKIWKKMSLRGSFKWLDILQQLVDDYHNTKHRTIKMRPIDVKKENEQNLLNTVYKINRKNKHPYKKYFKVGDFVRISKYKHVFEKGYTPNWTTEIFKIYKVQETYPTTYLLKDLPGESVLGGFYAEELQKAKYPDIFLVEKIIRKKKW